MKNKLCSNFHFKLKRNLDDKSDEGIDDIDDLFYWPYKKPKSDEKEDTTSTIVAVTANITSVICRTKKRAPRHPNLIRNKQWWDRCYRNLDMILNRVEPYLTKKKMDLNQHSTSVNKQLGLTLYRLGHGASFKTLS